MSVVRLRQQMGPQRRRTAEIEQAARRAGARVTGRIRYDPAVTKAQMAARAVVESDAPSAADIRGVWDDVNSSQKGESP
jgi:MinD superfamily P-loop ATPase